MPLDLPTPFAPRGEQKAPGWTLRVVVFEFFFGAVFGGVDKGLPAGLIGVTVAARCFGHEPSTRDIPDFSAEVTESAYLRFTLIWVATYWQRKP